MNMCMMMTKCETSGEAPYHICLFRCIGSTSSMPDSSWLSRIEVNRYQDQTRPQDTGLDSYVRDTVWGRWPCDQAQSHVRGGWC
jgi:hypothetical protein